MSTRTSIHKQHFTTRISSHQQNTLEFEVIGRGNPNERLFCWFIYVFVWPRMMMMMTRTMLICPSTTWMQVTRRSWRWRKAALQGPHTRAPPRAPPAPALGPGPGKRVQVKGHARKMSVSAQFSFPSIPTTSDCGLCFFWGLFCIRLFCGSLVTVGTHVCYDLLLLVYLFIYLFVCLFVISPYCNIVPVIALTLRFSECIYNSIFLSSVNTFKHLPSRCCTVKFCLITRLFCGAQSVSLRL